MLVGGRLADPEPCRDLAIRGALRDEIHDLLLWRDWVNSYKAGAGFFDQKLKGQVR